jgi:hypothetical protein
MYDPDAPRHAQLRIREVGFPAATVGVTDSGTYAVIADPRTPPHLIGHALDYADRLAELIPEQRPAEYVGRHRAPGPDTEPDRLRSHDRQWRSGIPPWALIFMVATQALVACAGSAPGG